MTKLVDHSSTQIVKLLLLGESGSGKTGALSSLVPSHRLMIADFDNGLDLLRHYIPTEHHDKVDFELFTDQMGAVAGKPSLKKATALPGFMKWIDTYEGGVYNWSSDTVLVIDSLTFMAKAAFNYVMFTEGRIGQAPRIQDWGAAMSYVENILALLYSDAVKCNVIVTSHITYLEDEASGGIVAGHPSAIGSKLPPKIPRFFNSVLLVKTQGAGKTRKHLISTVGEHKINCKSPAKLPAELPVETGLLTFFQAVRSGH